MKRRWWWVPFVALAGAAVWYGYDGELGRKVVVPEIEIKRIGRPQPAAVHARPPAASSSPRDDVSARSAEVATSPDEHGFYERSGEVRTVTSQTVIGKLQRDASVSEAEQERLNHVFKTASNIQLGIDAEPSLPTRDAYQRRLIEQVELRLQLILRDERRVNLAKAELRGLPRVDSDG